MATQQSSQEGTSHPNDLGQSSIFDYEELEEATKFFNPSEVIGEGGFGVVYRGMLKDGRAVAIKEPIVHDKDNMEQFINEARLLSRLHHKNLVTFYGRTNPENQKMLLVYEFVPNGTLADHLLKISKEALTWWQRLQIAINTAEALTYLHSLEPPIIHRDIKSENILLEDDFNAKVADFGTCCQLTPSRAHISTMPQGTQGYLDPEYNQLYKLTVKSDVFSFGVVMMELISGKAAVDIERGGDEIWLVRMAFNKMKNNRLDQFVDPQLQDQDGTKAFHMISHFAQLAFRCLQHTGDRRPPMIDVLKSLKSLSDHWPNMYRRSPTVCVTGADGFIGSWLVKLLLHSGYTVKGIVWNPDDTENNHLKALDGALERLILCKFGNDYDYDDLRHVFDGCVGVFHTITPLGNNGESMSNLTRYVVDAAADAGVRRVVYTSSTSAVSMSPDARHALVIDESWWSDPDYCQKMKSQEAYDMVLAERAAWETAGNRGLDLVVVCPALHVIGPQLLPGIGNGNGNALILQYYNSFICLNRHVACLVHVQDVAKAHLRVFEAPMAKGRYLCVETMLYHVDVAGILANLFPEYPLTVSYLDEIKPQRSPLKFSNEKLKDLGLEFTPVQQCLYDTVKSLQEKGHMPIINTT